MSCHCRYGKILVDVVVKRQKGPTDEHRSRADRMPFAKFIKDFNYQDWYLSSRVPFDMMPDLIVSCFGVGVYGVCVCGGGIIFQ